MWLSLVAISLILAPILLALKLHENRLEVGPQHAARLAAVSPQDAARWRSVGIGLAAFAAPVVLAYHDIRPSASIGHAVVSRRGRASRIYTISPEQFDQQLTMLQDAGYRSVTASEYVAFLTGGAVPSRSVLITFDGSTQGQWSFADQILARHHMHGMSFLNTRVIETHWTRYLSWPEIERMQATGRWEFESAVSSRTLAGTASSVASHLVARLQESLRAFQRHDLALPRLLTWPMPIPGAVPSPQGAIAAARVVRAPFVAALANGENLAPPTSRRAAAGKLMGRIEVARTIDPDRLLATVASSTAIPVSGVRPLAHPSGWTTGDGEASPVAVSGSTLRFTAGGTHEEVNFAQDVSADWENYVLGATIQDLKKSGADSGSIIVRVGSSQAVTVRVSARGATVLRSRGLRSNVLWQAQLFPSVGHHVRIVVRAGLTTFTVDHVTTFTLRERGGAGSAGGIGLESFRRTALSSWPSFSGVTVVPATAASTRADGVRPISVHAMSPLAASSLWVQSRFAPAAVLATEHTLQFTGARVHAFAEYAPVQTSQWTGYAFSATVENLTPGASVDLYGRLGSKSQAVAIVGQHQIKVYSGSRTSRTLIVSLRLSSSTSHRISLRVLARTTIVEVDGQTLASVPAMGGTAGGVAVGAKRDHGQAWPRLVDVTVAAVR